MKEFYVFNQDARERYKQLIDPIEERPLASHKSTSNQGKFATKHFGMKLDDTKRNISSKS